MNDSYNSALQENEAYLDSVAAKQTALNATFQEFANNVLTSDMVKNFLEFVNNLLKLANTDFGKIVTQFGILTSLGWGAGELVKVSKIIPTIISQFTTLGTIAGAAGAAGGITSLADAGAAAALVLEGSFLPVVMTIAGILMVGGYLWKATEDYRKSFSELTADIEDNTSKLETNKQRLEEINNMAWDEKTPAIQNEQKALEKENEELEKQIKKLNKLKDAKASTALDGTVTEKRYTVTKATGQASKYADLIQNVDFSSYKELEKYLGERIPDAAGKTKKELEDLGITFGVVERQVYKTGEAYQDALIDKAHDLTASLLSGKESAEEQKEAYEDVIKELTDYADKQDALGVSSDDTRDAIDRLTNAFEINTAVTEEAAGQTAITAAEAENLKNKYPQLAAAIQNVNGVNYLNVESLKAVTGASEEEVVAMYDAVAALTVFQNTQLDLSQQINEVYRLGEALGVAQSELAAFQQGVGQATTISSIMQEAVLEGKPISRAEAERIYTQSVWNRWKATTNVSNKVKSGVTKTTGTGTTAGTGSASKARSSAAKSTQKEETAEEKLSKAIKAANEAYSEQITILENRMYILEQQAPDDPLASEEALNQYKSVQEQKIAYYKQMQQKTHDLAEEYRRLGVKEESETLTDLGKKWWQYQKEIKDVYASISDYTDKFADKLKEQAEEVRQKAIEEAEKVREAEKEAINDTIDSLQRKQNAYEILFDYMSEQVDAEISKLEEEKSAVEDYWDERIQAIQDTNDATEESIELEEKLNNLAKAKAKKSYVFKDGRFQYVENVDEISQAQSELDAYNRQKALAQEVANLEKLKKKATDSIDAQIKNWQKYKDEWSSVVKKYQAEQNKLLVEQELGVKLEGNNWKNRVNQFSDFADQYKKVMSEIEDAQKELEEILTKEIVIPDIKIPDGIYMTEEDRIALAQAGRDYNNATTDAERKAAHERAEAIRRKYGYSGGIAGDEYIPTTSDSSSSSSNRKNNTSSSSNSSSSSSSGSKLPQDLAGRANNPDKYAEGTYRARGGLSIVGEKGPELRVLNTGDGILPGNVTKNLWDWGKINPNQFTGTNVTNVNVSNVSLPNVKTAEDFVAGLRNLAIQRAYKR